LNHSPGRNRLCLCWAQIKGLSLEMHMVTHLAVGSGVHSCPLLPCGQQGHLSQRQLSRQTQGNVTFLFLLSLKLPDDTEVWLAKRGHTVESNRLSFI
jgi:hypothetical protein